MPSGLEHVFGRESVLKRNYVRGVSSLCFGGIGCCSEKCMFWWFGKFIGAGTSVGARVCIGKGVCVVVWSLRWGGSALLIGL